MPEHPSDDYLIINPSIKISGVNCDLLYVYNMFFNFFLSSSPSLHSRGLYMLYIGCWMFLREQKRARSSRRHVRIPFTISTGRQRANHAPATNLLAQTAAVFAGAFVDMPRPRERVLRIITSRGVHPTFSNTSTYVFLFVCISIFLLPRQIPSETRASMKPFKVGNISTCCASPKSSGTLRRRDDVLFIRASLSSCSCPGFFSQRLNSK